MRRSTRYSRPGLSGSAKSATLLGADGDGSTLTLDFTTGQLDPRLTFNRASTATFINASGFVDTASNNIPRFDYDPTTLQPRGLLIEAASTNLLNWSESFATSGGTSNNWADTHITRNSTNNTDPKNSTTALRVTASSAHGTIISTTAMGTSAQRTFSIWLRRVSGTGDIQYTLDNGSTYTTQAITSSWVRYTFPATTAAQHVGIRIVTNGDSIELWGAQLEAGASSSSYISTGASTAQRLSDEVSMTGTNFSSWFTNSAEGSFYAKYSMNNPAAFFGASVDRYAFEVSNSAGTSRVFTNASYRVTTAGNAGRFPRVFDLGTIDLAPSFVATAAQNTSLSWGYKTNDNHLAAFGVTATDNSGTLQTGLDRIHIGASRSFSVTSYLNGCISMMKYWPTRLSNAQLQALIT